MAKRGLGCRQVRILYEGGRKRGAERREGAAAGAGSQKVALLKNESGEDQGRGGNAEGLDWEQEEAPLTVMFSGVDL